MIALAIIFLVTIFFLKNTSVFKNKETYQRAGQESGLTYGNALIKDLINKDTDGDKILDWEEGLWGTDPTKKETTPGTPDSVAIDKLSAQDKLAPGREQTEPSNENLTKTDQFSRELLATIVTLNQNGQVDQATIDKLGDSLAEQIQNSVPRKIYTVFDIKTTNSNTAQAFIDYNNALNNIYTKHPVTNYTILDVLQKFSADENDVDENALLKLDPIIAQTNKVIEEMLKISAPQSISVLHLNVINGLEKLSENISDIKLFDTDIIVALSAISKYQDTAARLELSLNNLANAINQKLNN